MAIIIYFSISILLLLLSVSSAWEEIPPSVVHHDRGEGLRQVYVIGDLHGDYGCATFWVANETGLVDISSPNSEDWKWTGPDDAVLIFMGDPCDFLPICEH